MQRFIFICACSLLLAISQMASAVSDQQVAAIKELGKLNGVALSCKRLDQTQRMKKAMVSNLPKIKALGDAFDDASHQSYLEFTSGSELCPLKSELKAKVGLAIERLKNAFPSKK